MDEFLKELELKQNKTDSEIKLLKLMGCINENLVELSQYHITTSKVLKNIEDILKMDV